MSFLQNAWNANFDTSRWETVRRNMITFSAMALRSPKPRLALMVLACVCLFVMVWFGYLQPTTLETATLQEQPPVNPRKDTTTDDSVVDQIPSVPALQRGVHREAVKLLARGKARFAKLPSKYYFLRPVRVKENFSYRATEVYPSTLESKEKFTLVMQTYNRTDLLIKLLNHYSGIQHLDRIVIVWNNLNQTPPERFWNSLKPHPTEVFFLAQKENKMRNRLKSFPEIRTEGKL